MSSHLHFVISTTPLLARQSPLSTCQVQVCLLCPPYPSASQIQLSPCHRPFSHLSLLTPYFPVRFCSAPTLFPQLLHTWNHLLPLCTWGLCSQALSCLKSSLFWGRDTQLTFVRPGHAHTCLWLNDWPFTPLHSCHPPLPLLWIFFPVAL